MPEPGSPAPSGSPAPAHQAEQFVAGHHGVKGLTVRIGAHSAALILVDGEGAWSRSVVTSTEAAHTVGERLGIPVSDGWTDELRRLVTGARRTPQDWARAPYPEQRRRTD